MMKNKTQSNKKQKGFSLIEILVVMSMMALLMGIVANQLQKTTQKGNIKATILMIKKLQMQMESFNSDLGYYPRSLDDLVSDNGDSNWLGPYVKKSAIKDAWKQKFNYITPGQHDEEFNIVSYGKDKSPGGSNFNKDINSWEI